MLRRPLNSKILLVILTLLLLAVSGQSQDRGAGTRVKYQDKNGQEQEIKMYEGRYALIIGESDYQYWQKLPGPKTDVEEVKKVFEEQGFNKVETDFDLPGEKLKARFEKFINDYGMNQPDNLLVIYFAGHGATLRSSDKKRNIGYIVPVDAPLVEIESEFRKKGITMDSIETYARNIQTKHVLFIFDSCFSGALLASRGASLPPAIGEYLRQPTRQFITSGAANQTVPDVSTFRQWFVRGIRGEADLTTDGYVTGSELAKFITENVTNNTRGAQTPQYGTLPDSELKGGDVVFFPPNGETRRLGAKPNPLIEPNTSPFTLSSAELNRTAVTNIRKAPVLGAFEFTTLSDSNSSSPVKKSASSYEEDLGSGIKLRLVYLADGKFKMGSNVNLDEKPVREVTVKNFFIGAYEVTQAQWRAVSNLPKVKINLPSDPSVGAKGDNLPVENISWEEAEEFCARLSQNTGREYSLPSEAEWEYAARGNTTTSFAFGERIVPDIVNYKPAAASMKGGAGVFRNQPVEIGSLGIANSFGLYDMHGNVAEWVADARHENYEGAPKDGSIWTGNSNERVVRGGSFRLFAERLCSTCRNFNIKELKNGLTGFRVVMRTPLSQ